MSLMRMTPPRSIYRLIKKSAGRYARPLLAALLALLVATGNVPPAFAQNPPPKQDPTQQDPSQQQPPPPGTYGNVPPASQAGPEAAAGTARPQAPPIPVSLGLSKHSFVHGPRAFPTLIAPYKPIQIDETVLVNSPRVDQLIHDGKLEITLQDAVELALENSMDIAVQRYIPWFADTDILATEAGSQPFGIAGAEIRQSFANIPFLNYDPTFTSQISYDDRKTPVNNPLTSGTGATATAASLVTHTATYNNSVTEGFSTGTIATLAWNNIRSSSGSTFNFFNPAVQSALVVSLQQELLNGFGRWVNRRNIMIAKNN